MFHKFKFCKTIDSVKLLKTVLYRKFSPKNNFLKDSMEFSSLLKTAEDDLRYILKNHSRFPYDIFAKELRDKYEKVPNLLNIILVGQEFYSRDVTMEYIHPGYEQPPFHLIINAVTSNPPDDFELLFINPAGMYEGRDLELMNSHLVNILRDVIKNPSGKIHEINLMNPAERKLLLHKFNDTKRDYPKDKTFIELFQENLSSSKEKIAAVYGDKDLTYGELNRRANIIGRLLRKKGVKPDDIVGIMVEPSLETILGPVGILKSGAAYMPVDPKFPPDRVRYMLEDSKSAVFLTQRHLAGRIDFEGEIIYIDDEGIYRGEDSDPEILSAPS